MYDRMRKGGNLIFFLLESIREISTGMGAEKHTHPPSERAPSFLFDFSFNGYFIISDWKNNPDPLLSRFFFFFFLAYRGWEVRCAEKRW